MNIEHNMVILWLPNGYVVIGKEGAGLGVGMGSVVRCARCMMCNTDVRCVTLKVKDHSIRAFLFWYRTFFLDRFLLNYIL